jgi:hypothetical protein
MEAHNSILNIQDMDNTALPYMTECLLLLHHRY